MRCDFILDFIQNRPYALHPSKLEEISTLVEKRFNSHDDVLLRKQEIYDDETVPYEIRNGVAIIPVEGVIEKKMNLFTNISGGTSSEILKQDIKSALDDSSVKSILLRVYSPGGAVHIKDTADFVFNNRDKKPIIGFADGLGASAAYWLLASTSFIIATDVSSVGSIGVALMHYNRSAQDEKIGIERTAIYAGEYKRISSDEKPLSKQGKEYLQSLVDHYYSIFVDSVAQYRGISAENVLNMANGKDFIGYQALEVGLIDAIGDLDYAINIAEKEGFNNMDLTQLKQEHPELYSSVFEMGVESVDSEAIRLDERTLERERVVAILNVEGADIEAKQEAIKNGLSVEAAYKVFWESQQQQRQEDLKSLGDDVPPVPPDGKEKEGDKFDFMAEVDAYQKEHGCNRTKALSAIHKQNPDGHAEWLANQ